MPSLQNSFKLITNLVFTWNLHVMRNSTVSLSKNTCFVVWRWVFPMFSNTKFAHYTCWNHPDTRACAVKTMGHISAGVGLLVISLFCAYSGYNSPVSVDLKYSDIIKNNIPLPLFSNIFLRNTVGFFSVKKRTYFLFHTKALYRERVEYIRLRWSFQHQQDFEHLSIHYLGDNLHYFPPTLFCMNNTRTARRKW